MCFRFVEISQTEVDISLENTKRLYEKALVEHCGNEQMSLENIQKKYQCPPMSNRKCSEGHIVVWFANGELHSDSLLYIEGKGWYTSWEGHDGCNYNDSYGFEIKSDIMKIYRILTK